MPRYSPPLPFRRGRAGARACGPARGAPGSGVAVLRAVSRAQTRAPRSRAHPRAWRRGRGLVRCVACPGPRPGSRWPAGARPARGTRTSAARLRTGGEEESPRTGDSNPGCNCLVRGYSPSMHFFWGGDMPRYSPPLPFRRGRAGCPCVRASPRGARLGGRGLARCVACPGPRPGSRWSCCPARGGARLRGRGRARWLACPGLRPRTRLAVTAPRFSPVFAPLLA